MPHCNRTLAGALCALVLVLVPACASSQPAPTTVRARPHPDAVMQVMALQHSDAGELAAIISELVEEAGPRGCRGPAPSSDEPPVRVIADERLNALIVYAAPKILTRVHRLVSELDVPN